ncbi:TM2 domain protein [Corynebacterium atrinae]|uniref:TM2 domain-containing protein n=1 Tax=Corynebacterium atrinae TaxID=1336740 RepID=UPI0025B3FEE9|nr:TM2 domain-containing protein [Corynebacterium atrinae]WJY63277.1 TM2 domain protein [Corynebacterium atrinae]
MTQPYQHYDQDGMPIDPAAHNYHAFAQPQYAVPVQQYGYPAYAQKSKIVAALLAFFFGTLGVHNFYLGYTNRGVIQLGLTILGWFTAIFLIGFIFIMVVGVWAFVEFILILVGGGQMAYDSHGVPLS